MYQPESGSPSFSPVVDALAEFTRMRLCLPQRLLGKRGYFRGFHYWSDGCGRRVAGRRKFAKCFRIQ